MTEPLPICAECENLKHDLERAMDRANDYMNADMAKASLIERLTKGLERARPFVVDYQPVSPKKLIADIDALLKEANG